MGVKLIIWLEHNGGVQSIENHSRDAGRRVRHGWTLHKSDMVRTYIIGVQLTENHSRDRE